MTIEISAHQWDPIRAAINDYSMHMVDASLHQAASKRDIAQAAALSALQKVRRAIEATSFESFQERVEPWMRACFGFEVSRDRTERSHRFIEEALELVQAAGCTASEAHQLVDYVFGRAVGELPQEVGGVMVTLAALCLAQGVDMHAAGETELARVWTKIDVIRAKHAAKPKHSPLPGASENARETLPDAFWEALQRLMENAVTQGPASMEDARLVGRFRDVLAALAAPAVARVAPRAPLPLMQQAFRTTETMGVPECIYRMIFDFPSLAALQAAEAEWVSAAGARIVQQVADSVEPLRLLAPQPTPARDVVPGKVHCAKCGFTLQRVNLYMLSGTTGAGGEETEPCPNDGTPLLRVTWEQEAREAWKMGEQQFDRAHALEAALAELVACKNLKAIIDRGCGTSEEVERNRAWRVAHDDYYLRKDAAWSVARALLPQPKGPDHG